MKINIIKNDDSTININIEDSSAKWTGLFEKAKASLIKNMELPGFRKGKVPHGMALKNIKDVNVLNEAKRMHLNDLYQSGLEEAKDYRIITSPIAKDNELSKEKINITFTVGVMPEIKLSTYKNLEYKFNKIEVSQEEIDRELSHLQQRFSMQEVKENGTLNMNDIGIIDFEGFLNGVAFEGGRGQNHPLEIGSKTFIPGFEDQLVGMKKNEIREIKVVFPEEYQVNELKGKEVTFKVKLNEIKTKKLPTLDDNLAKDMNLPDIKTFDQLVSKVKESITKSKENGQEQEFRRFIMNEIIKDSDIPVPASLKDNELKYLIEDLKGRLSQQGLTFDKYVKMSGAKEEDIKKQLEVEAIQRIKVSFALSEIAKDEKIDISNKRLDDELVIIAKNRNESIEDIKANINVEQIRNSLKNNEVINFIRKNLKK